MFILRRTRDVAITKFAGPQIDSVLTQVKRTRNVLIGVAATERYSLMIQAFAIALTPRTVTLPVRVTDPSVPFKGYWKVLYK